MKEINISKSIKVFEENELSAEDKAIIEAAKKATDTSYAPYSQFRVGAAVRLKNGTIISGSNQENAAYPSGLCAERTTLFYANASNPDQPVMSLAIAARNANGFLAKPAAPCGACRQVILETETRFNQPIRILLYGKEETYVIDGISTLLPLCFDASDMEV